MDRLKNMDKNLLQLMIIVVITLTAGLYRNGFPALFPFMQAEFEVSRAVLGLYTSFLYMVSGALALFSGWVADSIGAKKALFLGTATLGILIALHALAPSYAVILFLGIVCGIGFSIISPGASKAVADRFAPSERGTPMGLIFVGWSVGGLLGAVTLPTFSELFGWRWASVAMGVFMLLVIIIFYFVYNDPEAPAEGGDEKSQEVSEEEEPTFKEGFFALLSDKYTLLLGFAALMFGSISGILATHYTLFVHLDYGYPEALAGLGFAFLHAGSIVGRPAWGYINDKFLVDREHVGFLLISLSNVFVLVAFGVLSRVFAAPPIVVLFIFTFLAGFSGRGWPGMLFTAVSRQADARYAGMALGFALVFVRAGVTIAPPLFGYVADITGTYELGWFLAAAITIVGGLVFYILGARQARERVQDAQ